MLFHKEAFQVFTLYNLQIENAHIYCRFSLKNVLLLEKWEKAVNNANNSSEWKAADFPHLQQLFHNSRLCNSTIR